MADLVESMKKAALGAVEASKPPSVVFGTVVSASPLRINIEQKLTLESVQLILTRNVTDYTVEMSVEHSTETADGHTHAYTGKKLFTVHNGLVDGDKVLLLRVQGGQKYVVWDRLT